MTPPVGRWHERDTVTPELFDPDAREAWAGDRERFFVFLVDVTDDAVHDALEPVRETLAAHDCTTVAPPDYYHVPVKQAGCVTSRRCQPSTTSATSTSPT
jgi:hypothetical protein